MSKPIVIVTLDDGGYFSIQFAGDVDVFCVDRNCATEPAYQMTLQSPEENLRREVGKGPWPNAGDDRHAAITASIEERLDGKPRLSLVPNRDQPT